MGIELCTDVGEVEQPTLGIDLGKATYSFGHGHANAPGATDLFFTAENSVIYEYNIDDNCVHIVGSAPDYVDPFSNKPIQVWSVKVGDDHRFLTPDLDVLMYGYDMKVVDNDLLSLYMKASFNSVPELAESVKFFEPEEKKDNFLFDGSDESDTVFLNRFWSTIYDGETPRFSPLFDLKEWVIGGWSPLPTFLANSRLMHITAANGGSGLVRHSPESSAYFFNLNELELDRKHPYIWVEKDLTVSDGNKWLVTCKILTGSEIGEGKSFHDHVFDVNPRWSREGKHVHCGGPDETAKAQICGKGFTTPNWEVESGWVMEHFRQLYGMSRPFLRGLNSSPNGGGFTEEKKNGQTEEKKNGQKSCCS